MTDSPNSDSSQHQALSDTNQPDTQQPYEFATQYRRCALMLSSATLNNRLATIPDELLEAMTMRDAYEIQHANAERWQGHGWEFAGYKCEGVSNALREQYGLAEPIYGHIFEDQRVAPDTAVSVKNLTNPEIKAALIAKFSLDVDPVECNVHAIRTALDAVYPALEITDSRFGGWEQPLEHIVADQAHASMYVLGKRGQAATKIDLKTLVGALVENDETVAEGSGKSIMGDPYESAVWLAKQLEQRNIMIKAGQTVILGGCTRSVPVKKGAKYEASFKSLGSVSIRIQAD